SPDSLQHERFYNTRSWQWNETDRPTRQRVKWIEEMEIAVSEQALYLIMNRVYCAVWYHD
ncbi:MAG TPA: hypothetical protein VMW91_01575, partial [Desulfosporosinus sp.]|nr:hypothetical protein [Desulfosporosinus sp.]